MNALARRLLADVPGIPVVFDDPTLLDRWTGGRTPERILDDVLDDLDRADLPTVYAVMAGDDFVGALVAHDRHPCLDQIAAFVRDAPGIVLVASPSGPPPPAVFVMERER